MKLSTTFIGLGIGAIVLTGCGGGSDALEATGKITQQEAVEVAHVTIFTGLDPVELLSEDTKDTASKNLKGVYLPNEDGEYECPGGGSYTYKKISGVNPSFNEDESGNEVHSSTFIFEINYNKCDEYHTGVTVTGTKKGTWKWEEKEDETSYSYTNNWESTMDGVVYEGPEGKFTTSTYTASGTNKKTSNAHGSSWSSTSQYVRSGTLVVDGNETYEFKNITRDREEKRSYNSEDDSSTYERTWKISGLLKSDDSDGWIAIETPETLVKNQDDMIDEYGTLCPHAGELTVSGAEHTLSVEYDANHSVTLEYDGEVIKRFANCIEFEEYDPEDNESTK